MRSISKFLAPVIAAGFAITLFSCNNDGEKKEEKKAADSTAVAPKPFKVLIVEHKVANFNSWKTGYLAHDSMRLAYGVSQFRLGRGLEDSNMVMVVDKISDVQKAKDFVASPTLKDAMQKSGVVGQPTIAYVDLIRTDTSIIPQLERVMISHKVKDFDAWLKAFDGEGTATRAANGLRDRVLGRGVDDPNMVYIVFAITDMAKAKARMNSPELKKLMTDAGVEGAPTVFMYKTVQ